MVWLTKTQNWLPAWAFCRKLKQSSSRVQFSPRKKLSLPCKLFIDWSDWAVLINRVNGSQERTSLVKAAPMQRKTRLVGVALKDPEMTMAAAAGNPLHSSFEQQWTLHCCTSIPKFSYQISLRQIFSFTVAHWDCITKKNLS